MNREEYLKKILLYFGQEKQMIKFAEEASELMSEIARMMNGRGNTENMVEEMADVWVIGSQLTLILDRDKTITYELKEIDIMQYLNVAISFCLSNDKDVVDAIETCVAMVVKHAEQLDVEHALWKEVDFKISRTIEWIDKGKYNGMCAK